MRNCKAKQQRRVATQITAELIRRKRREWLLRSLWRRIIDWFCKTQPPVVNWANIYRHMKRHYKNGWQVVGMKGDKIIARKIA